MGEPRVVNCLHGGEAQKRTNQKKNRRGGEKNRSQAPFCHRMGVKCQRGIFKFVPSQKVQGKRTKEVERSFQQGEGRVRKSEKPVKERKERKKKKARKKENQCGEDGGPSGMKIRADRQFLGMKKKGREKKRRW